MDISGPPNMWMHSFPYDFNGEYKWHSPAWCDLNHHHHTDIRASSHNEWWMSTIITVTSRWTKHMQANQGSITCWYAFWSSQRALSELLSAFGSQWYLVIVHITGMWHYVALKRSNQLVPTFAADTNGSKWQSHWWTTRSGCGCELYFCFFELHLNGIYTQKTLAFRGCWLKRGVLYGTPLVFDLKRKAPF